MTIAKLDARGSTDGNVSPAGWNGFRVSDNGVNNLLDTTGSLTGWSFQYTAEIAFGAALQGSSFPAPTVGSGAIAWVDNVQVLGGGHGSSSTTVWDVGVFAGLNPNKKYNIGVTGYTEQTGTRISDFQVNELAIQSVDNVNNTTNGALFTEISPNAQGEIFLKMKRNPSNTAFSYFSAAYIEEIPGPEVTLGNPPQLGATLSFTYANYAGIPVGPLAFEQGARSLPDEAVTITDNGDGTGSGVTDTALPDIPANGESVTPFPLIGVGIDITLPDPGV